MSVSAALRKRFVSRETQERLQIYEAMLRKWNPSINLVARSTLDDVWGRHFLDSAQLFDLAGQGWKAWTDLGSGGGFPGLVIAILAAEDRREAKVILIESDQRKAAFLSAVTRELGLSAIIRPERIESLPRQNVDILSARALAPLNKLLSYAEIHLAADGTALFPKGANQIAELHQALEIWNFSYEMTESTTNPGAVIYSIKGLSRV